MINGIKITPLKQILDERGKIMPMLRNDSPDFSGFGEIYFSCVYPNVIKGWHRHKKMILNYAVLQGRIKLVIHDDRSGSPSQGETQEIYMGPDNYALVTVPAMVWNGFKGIGTEMAIVANCASIPHDPEEIERLDPLKSKILYQWDLVHR